MTYDEAAAKFEDFCARFATWPNDKMAAIVESVRTLEEIKDVRSLAKLCSG